MGVRFGVVSTYPTTQCGIATFTESLVRHLRRLRADVGVVRLVDARENQTLPVVHQWVTGVRSAVLDVIEVLNDYDVALLQHEYGIYGGQDGEDVLEVATGVRVPVITVLHTVLTNPTAHQYQVLADLCAASSAIITLTETARQRLLDGWAISPDRVTVITHGAEANLPAGATRGFASPRTILTWGLLGPGKGIEWALRALSRLPDLQPRPRYHIVGQTHPRVLERSGERYRQDLVTLTHDLGLDDHVQFNRAYLPGEELRRIVRQSDIVLLPYDSREQVTSGVLTEAVAAGKPVVSTAFPHAVELLSDGAGLLVPQGDPVALADALRRVMTEDGLAARMAGRSRQLAESLTWPAVAARYIDLASDIQLAERTGVR